MKYKKLTYYVDLVPGWHDQMHQPDLCDAHYGLTPKFEGCKRIRITVELPMFGGSEDVDGSADATAMLD